MLKWERVDEEADLEVEVGKDLTGRAVTLPVKCDEVIYFARDEKAGGTHFRLVTVDASLVNAVVKQRAAGEAKQGEYHPTGEFTGHVVERTLAMYFVKD